MIEFLLQLSTWQIIRVAGLAAFLLLTLGMALGISYSFWWKSAKRSVYRVHSFLTIAGTAIGLLHGATTVIDTYSPYSWRDLLIPFSAAHAPILSGLGTLCGYGMLIVILTTDLRNKLKRPLWLLFHLLSYPIYATAFVHGFFLGTDSELPIIRMLYALSALLILGLTAVRATKRSAGAKKRPSGGNAAKPVAIHEI
ncbi:ferric reductase-like transmembrane domain-containing protein [Paenibacillus montanisoli]|uniref:Ferric reductase n=1 Tax=Paenibacillus montanisoli TaxID=2081970 RepID=A0A328TUW0_9BACL|nr:ferric reductase-like transmembrane domain-containing protein [Paenibacillus montanisoli]RAP74130.1 ferric reductase [Paenibacillus montanisoli]